MNYHTIIAVENRKPTVNPDGSLDKSRLTLPITTDVIQLHSMGSSIKDINNPNILYVASWDGISPWVVILKGSIAGLNMAYAGWPMVTQTEWKASQSKEIAP